MAFAFVDKARQTGSLVTSFSMTVDVGTGADRLLVVALMQRGASLVEVTSMTYNSVALTRAVNGQNDVPTTKLRADIWYLANPTSGSNTLQVDYGAQVSQYECQASWYVGADDVTVVDDTDSGSGQTATPSVSLTPTANGQLLVACTIHEDPSALSTGTGETTIYNFDNGAWVTSSSYAIQTTAATQSMDWTAPAGADYWAAAGASFFVAADPNTSPAVALNTADLSTLGTTPTLEFTGTDDQDDDIRYNIQIADNPDWLNGTIVTNSLTSGSGTVIHPNPTGGLTWEGHRQVDDRVGISFQAAGGILDSIDFYFGAHETTPAKTDGSYLARVYDAEGHPVDPVPPIWVASTTYTAGDIVRPTSTANANVHFVYRCKVGGTSGGSEPSWPGNGVNWQSVTPGQEVTDNTVTWEALPGMHPVDAADESETPTAGWLAQSTVYSYAPGVADGSFKTLAFTGSNRIRLVRDQWYMVILDWRPNDTDSDNTIAVQNADFANATAPGNTYLDGPGISNNGPRIISDAWHRIREVLDGIDADSGVPDDGFENTVTPLDESPFNSDEKIAYTVQSIDELDTVGHWWRVRGIDPSGTNLWGAWSEVRSFDVTEGETALGIAITPDTTRTNGIRIYP